MFFAKKRLKRLDKTLKSIIFVVIFFFQLLLNLNTAYTPTNPSLFDMDSIPLKLTTQVRKCLTMIFLLGAALSSNAQTNVLPSFQVNFAAADLNAYGVSFKQENNDAGVFDFVVVQRGEEIFRFRNFDSNKETLHSFVLINDKTKSLTGLQTQSTLTKKADVEADILSAYDDKALVIIGFLESRNATGASTRMQIVKMVEEDTDAVLSEVQKH
jgi:hypothetical protein